MTISISYYTARLYRVASTNQGLFAHIHAPDLGFVFSHYFLLRVTLESDGLPSNLLIASQNIGQQAVRLQSYSNKDCIASRNTFV